MNVPAATPTHIVPQRLIDLGFPFRYDFASSLQHWKTIAPEDFASPPAPIPYSAR